MSDFREGELVDFLRYGAHAQNPPYPRGIVVGFDGSYIRVLTLDDRLFRLHTTANCNEYELRLVTPRPSLRQLWSQP